MPRCPALKAAGADAIVLLIHQGARTKGGYNDKSCPALDGDILPILDRLDPAIGVVVSGHTHAAYICERARPGGGAPILLTSAGRYGTLITDMRLTIDPARGLVAQPRRQCHRPGRRLWRRSQLSDGRAAPSPPTRRPRRWSTATSPPRGPRRRASSGGWRASPTRKADEDRESSAGNFIADAQLAAARGAGAQIAFINSGGVRADLDPGGRRQRHLRRHLRDAAVRQQHRRQDADRRAAEGAARTAIRQRHQHRRAARTCCCRASGFAFDYDLSRPAGQRIVAMALDGRAIDPAATLPRRGQ